MRIYITLSNYCEFAAYIAPENGTGDSKPDLGTAFSIELAMGRKRKTTDGGESDEEDNDTAAPPAHDIYRSRQQKRSK